MNRLFEAIDQLESFTLNEESVEDVANRVYSKVEANYKGSEINPETIYKMTLEEIPNDENARLKVMAAIMSDWEWFDVNDQASWEEYMLKAYNIDLKKMYQNVNESSCKEDDGLDNNLKVINYTVENTGGNTDVAMGKLANGQYFGLSDDGLVIFDADYHKAYLSNLTAGETNWEEEHMISSYNSSDTEYEIVLDQIDELK